MNIVETGLPGVLVIENDAGRDVRGPKRVAFSASALARCGAAFRIAAEYVYCPEKAGTLYGIHFQNHPKAQAKLICCERGAGIDCAVDLRRDSPNYRRWTVVRLDGESPRQVYLPEGFGHAFLSLADDTVVRMWVSEDFDPACRRGIAWNDPEIGVEWPIQTPILAAHDVAAPLLRDSDINL